MQGHHILYNASVLKARNSSLKKGKGKKGVRSVLHASYVEPRYNMEILRSKSRFGMVFFSRLPVSTVNAALFLLSDLQEYPAVYFRRVYLCSVCLCTFAP